MSAFTEALLKISEGKNSGWSHSSEWDSKMHHWTMNRKAGRFCKWESVVETAVKFSGPSEQDRFCEVPNCWNSTSIPRSPVQVLFLLLEAIPASPKSSPSSTQPPPIPPRPPEHFLSLGCLSANTPFRHFAMAGPIHTWERTYEEQA